MCNSASQHLCLHNAVNIMNPSMVNRHAKVYMYLTKCHIRNQISLSITCKENIKFRMSNGMKEKKEKSEKGKKMVIALNE